MTPKTQFSYAITAGFGTVCTVPFNQYGQAGNTDLTMNCGVCVIFAYAAASSALCSMLVQRQYVPAGKIILFSSYSYDGTAPSGFNKLCHCHIYVNTDIPVNDIRSIRLSACWVAGSPSICFS